MEHFPFFSFPLYRYYIFFSFFIFFPHYHTTLPSYYLTNPQVEEEFWRLQLMSQFGITVM